MREEHDVIDADFVELPEDEGGDPRCAVLLLLDTSASMSGDPIAELNAGLREFSKVMADDALAARRCEVAVVAFGGSVQVVQDFEVVANMGALPTLAASGDTPMGAGIARALDMITQKKEQYRQEGRAQYRPWVFMMTDGCPTDDVNAVIPRIHQGDAKKSFLFFAVGCFSADMARLKQIAPPSTPPVYLRGADFRGMFKWLSDSLSAVSSSTVGQHVALPAVTNWGQITT
jgi:uncharacterized protein YegL